jgi:tetratricopeptide (TPR) repeat protein
MPPPTPTLAPSAPVPPEARLLRVQHRFQDWNNCGPATLTMALTYYQVFHTQTDAAAFLKPDPEDRNVSPWEMAAYVNEYTDLAALYRVNGSMDTLRRLLAAGFPVIAEVGIDPPGDYAWMEWYGHYLLPVAYEDASSTFWVYDSWFGTSEVPQENADALGREISYDIFDDYWRQFIRSYVVLYPAAEQAAVEEIVGADMDDAVMWQNALRTVQSELQADPEDAHAWFNLGTVYNALQDYERAADAFDHGRSLGLPWRMLWYQFGPYEAYYEVGRYEDVIVLADVSLEDRPYFEEAFYYKGLALAALGDAHEARRNLESAAAFNPNFAPAQAALESLQ